MGGRKLDFAIGDGGFWAAEFLLEGSGLVWPVEPCGPSRSMAAPAASDGATETNYDRAKFAATGLVLVGLFRTASEFRPSALGKSDPRLVSHKAGCLGKAGFMECGLELYIRVSPVIALADNVWRHWTPALHVSFFLAPVVLRASRNRSYTADEDAG